ncbi:ATP-binding protein [Micromonospora sp. WMMD1082]|uniref:ATP-binding protein n=1 Tax=Micromonospora sp. WMMD1082 TaxID=3016104 RepID=UPI0024166593|nr:ATP-binding protein [Micromonospora sp. WMMD1082]MDG4795528.1 ATP-binding protein [Micromonospora sp. WMMD1082]
MREDSRTVEVLRRRFRNGDPASPLRHSARAALLPSACDDPDAEWIDDVLIVISELVQNVSQHTRGDGELVVTVAPGTVLVEVGDTSTTTPQARRPDSDHAGGRGLVLIEAISQKWGVRSCRNGKAVWAKLCAITTLASSSRT